MMKEMYAQSQPRISKRMRKKLILAKFQLRETIMYERLGQKELKNSIETGNVNLYFAKKLPYTIKKHTKILN